LCKHCRTTFSLSCRLVVLSSNFRIKTLLTIFFFSAAFISAQRASAQIWTTSSSPSLTWSSVASSADGSVLVAIGSSAPNYYIYTSTNFGTSWSLSGAPSKVWTTVAASADGKLLLAAAATGGIYSSTNFGSTWQTNGVPVNATWISVAASANGSTLIAGAQFGYVYYSTNMGANWQNSGNPSSSWGGLLCSADGTKLAAISVTQQLYTSTNSGASWNHSSPPADGGLRCSADGGLLLQAATSANRLYCSTDWGVTWTYNSMPISSFPYRISGDGKKIVVLLNSAGGMHISTNLGVTWTTNYAPGKSWSGGIAISADGSRMAATTSTASDKIYFWQPPSLIVTNSGSNLAFSWPTNGTAFKLQMNTNLTSANWVNSPNVPTVNNGMNQVIVARTNSNAFFRLISQ